MTTGAKQNEAAEIKSVNAGMNSEQACTYVPKAQRYR